MGCESVQVAGGDSGSVTICSCGTVSVNYGNATIRVLAEDFTAFARMVDESYAKLAEMELTRRQGIYPGKGPFCC